MRYRQGFISRIPRPSEGWIQVNSSVKDNSDVIWLRTSPNCCDIMMLDISLKKIARKPVGAVISLSICTTGIEKTIQLDEWTGHCDFFGLPRPCKCYCDITYRFVFDIHTKRPEDDCGFGLSPQLHEEIGNFVMESSLSDVKIVIDNEEIPAHKLVLGAHSSVFYTMIQALMKGSNKDHIVITDVKVDIMKVVLIFLYTGRDVALNEPKLALEALIAAEKYQLLKLKDTCERKLAESLTIENVLKMLNHSDECKADYLQAKCLDFMVENKKRIVKDKYFEELYLAKPLLMLKFLKNIADEDQSFEEVGGSSDDEVTIVKKSKTDC